MRPTGKLHIGHYFGALENWVRLQNDPAYDCFYFIADWHALTSDYADTSNIAQNVIEITTDYLAAGLDPAKSVLFQQSQVPEHAELHLLLSMVTPLGWLERVPTYKEQIENVKEKDLHTYGFLGYPCLQTADIVMYSEPPKDLVVPVGEDQVSHVELSREIVRRFNYCYAEVASVERLRSIDKKDTAIELFCRLFPEEQVPPQITKEIANRMANRIDEVLARSRRDNNAEIFAGQHAYFGNFVTRDGLLTEPDVMLTKTPRIPGTDGRKMSKSYGNAITLSESDDDIRKKTKVMVTDPARKRRTDPGNPDICPVGDWHKLFSANEPGRLDWVYKGCTTAGIGCIECKAAMAENLIKWIAPVRERRVEYEKHPKRVMEILDHGSTQAQKVAQKTMHRVREAVFHWKDKRSTL